MKKQLTILGVIVICFIVAGAIVLSGLYYCAKGLDKEAKTYVDHVILTIATSWDTKEVINHASTKFLQDMPPEKIESLFDTLSELIGPLEEYKGATGKIKIRISSEGKPIIIADYVAEAVFEMVLLKSSFG